MDNNTKHVYQVGDRVRFNDPSGSGYHSSVQGAHYTVKSVTDGLLLLKAENPDYNTIEVRSSRVAPAPKSDLGLTAIEALIQKANEGREALEQLFDIPGVEYSEGPIWRALSQAPLVKVSRLRYVKPTPKFEPFATKSGGWVVDLHEGILRISCKEFNVSAFLEWAADRENRSVPQSCRGVHQDLRAISGLKDGIKFFFDGNENHTLAWDDFDRIVSQLKKAGIK